MTYPGSDAQAPGAQPAPAPAPWTPPQNGPQGSPEAPSKSGAKKWLPIAGGVVGLGVVATGVFGFLGAGTSDVGDCIKTTSDTDYETVDCGSADAEFEIVGIDEQEMTYADFAAAPAEDLCADFADKTEYVLWEGVETETGTIYCAAPV